MILRGISIVISGTMHGILFAMICAVSTFVRWGEFRLLANLTAVSVENEGNGRKGDSDKSDERSTPSDSQSVEHLLRE